MKIVYFTLILFLINSNLFSQEINYDSKIDSLNLILKSKNLSYEEQIKNHGIIANLYANKEDYANSTLHLNIIDKLAFKENDSITIGKIIKSKAAILYFKNKEEEFLKEISNAINYLKSIKKISFDKTEEIYSCYTLLSEAFIQSNNYGGANKAILNAFNYISKRNDSIEAYATIDALNTQGYIYSEIENNAEALKNLNKALELENKIDDKYGKANTYNAIAIIYSKQKDDLKAIEYYKQAINLNNELNLNDLNGAAYCNLGISYYQLKDYNKAKENLFKSIEYSKSLSDKRGLADNYLYLGKIYIDEGKIDIGLQNIARSMALAKEINSPTFIIENLLVKADLAEKNKNKEKALSYLTEAEKISNETETLEIKERVLEGLAINYKDIDETKHSFYKNKHQKLSDSIKNVQQKYKTDVLKAEFDNLKIKADLKNKEKDLLLAQEKEEAAKTKLYLLIALGSVFILSLIIILLRQRKLNKTQKKMWDAQKEVLVLKEENIKNEVNFKNQQITDFAIHISEKNDLLEKIKRKIKQLPSKDSETSKQITNLILFINDDINQNKEKAQLYSEIDQTAESFNHKINSLFDDLTQKEKKIATLVRLNHTSKQIALQLNISPASVDNYRSSLRKKMNIPKGTSLAKFIKGL